MSTSNRFISHVQSSLRNPIILILLGLLIWFLVIAIVNLIISFVSQLPLTSPVVQISGTIGSVIILLVTAWRLRLIKASGISSFGSLKAWLVTILLGVGVIVIGFYAYFGEINFTFQLFKDGRVGEMVFHDVFVAINEELLFRGIILSFLISVLGRTKNNLSTAIVIQALMFGVLHLLQGLTGMTIQVTLANVFTTFVFGLLLGILTSYTKTLWPAIFIHLVANAVVTMKGLSYQWLDPYYLGYLRDAMFELPIVLLGFWIVFKTNFIVRPEEIRIDKG